jgi:hypothetical protein
MSLICLFKKEYKMIIADLSYFESASEVICDLRGGNASAYGDAFAQAHSRSGLAFTSTTLKTFAVQTSYAAVAVAAGAAVAIAVNIPSFP